MEIQVILSIAVLIMAAVFIAQLLAGRKKSETESAMESVISLLRSNNEELRGSIDRQLSGSATEQFRRFDLIQERVHKTLDERLDKVNATLESKIKSLQESNEKRLAQIQGVVDEKLQKTLESRIAQSFALVGKQLDSVQQGLGEMKNLAADAKSLKNALTNVKDRGTYGEVRLEKLLDDIFAPNQFSKNVEIADGKRVEFVINLPGGGDIPLLLPIDSKFPIEDYNRLLEAEDKAAIDEARKALALRIRGFARDIHDKYIKPPKTTDFALLFLPTEGLYAEVVQNAALFEELRDKYKVTAVGGATLAAFLGSLQVGFKTLKIEKEAQKVWDTLRAVKKQFGDFEKLLSQARKQLQTVDGTMEQLVGRRTRAINKALRNVEELGNAGEKPRQIETDEDEEDTEGVDE